MMIDTRKLNLGTELEKLSKAITNIRAILWHAGILDLSSKEATETRAALALVASNTTAQINEFIVNKNKEFYKAKINAGSLVVMTQYYMGIPEYGEPKTFPRLESGDIFLFLGLSDKNIPKWLIEEKVYEHTLPITSFKVLSSSLRDVVKKLEK